MPAIGFSAALLAFAAAWYFSGIGKEDLERFAEAVAPFRTRWYALPLTLLVFVVAELVIFPVLLLIFACGVVFGPWLGAAYGLAGAVVSALVPFAIGRWLGRDYVKEKAEMFVERVERVLARRGVIAVFLVRKIPAPYTFVNVVCGALGVSVYDFVIGTVLGMGTGVIVITVLGGHLVDTLRDPDVGRIAIGIGLLIAPLLVALLVQRLTNRRREQLT